LKKKLESLRQGIDNNFNVEIGSLTTENQLETVKKHLEDALCKEAKAFIPKYKQTFEKGFFHHPVILENVNIDMVTMREETFGPLLCIKKVVSVDEAIRLTNNSNLGLTASVWTEDRIKAHHIASRLEVGSVTINDHLMSHGLAETPWGGWKESGIGRTHSFLGLEEMTQPRVVIDDLMPMVKKNMWWYPHSKDIYYGLKGSMEFLYSKNLLIRFDGLIKLIKVFARSFRE
jgi:succinate-semialdehyde dehydrogenase/glutarate-semialdehyde dehydrogenase